MSTLNDSVQGAQIHVVPAAAATYRAEGGPSDPIEAQRRLRRVLSDARPIARELPGLDPPGIEAWGAEDDEHGRRITGYVIRWRAHVVVLAISVRDIEDATLEGATWTHAALEQYAASRSVSRAAAEPELALACWDARAVDVVVTPESWRWRSRLLGLDVSLVVQRVDRDGTPLVVAAEARTVNSGGPAGRRRRR